MPPSTRTLLKASSFAREPLVSAHGHQLLVVTPAGRIRIEPRTRTEPTPDPLADVIGDREPRRTTFLRWTKASTLVVLPSGRIQLQGPREKDDEDNWAPHEDVLADAKAPAPVPEPVPAPKERRPRGRPRKVVLPAPGGVGLVDLSPVEEAVWREHVKAAVPRTLPSLGDQFKVTKQRVGQIATALRRRTGVQRPPPVGDRGVVDLAKGERRRRSDAKRPTYRGVVVWRGPGELGGHPLVVIATGYRTGATGHNTKLGNVIQLWILREDVDPLAAIQDRTDEAVCGDCELRGDPATGLPRGCYVPVQWYPRKVWLTYRRGRYATLEAAELERDPWAGRTVRLGAYGDPGAVPIEVWEEIRRRAKRVIGYSRQWRDRVADPELRRYAMASVFTPEERERAKAAGWRTFRGLPVSRELENDIDHVQTLLQPGEVLCRHFSHGVTCEKCRLCDGHPGELDRRADIAVPVHGPGKVRNGYRRVVEQLGRASLPVLR